MKILKEYLDFLDEQVHARHLASLPPEYRNYTSIKYITSKIEQSRKRIASLKKALNIVPTSEVPKLKETLSKEIREIKKYRKLLGKLSRMIKIIK